jgi:hypothetical protein
MVFKKNRCYENIHPGTSTYIRVVEVLTNNSFESNLRVQFLTKTANDLIALDEIRIKADDYERWTEKK